MDLFTSTSTFHNQFYILLKTGSLQSNYVSNLKHDEFLYASVGLQQSHRCGLVVFSYKYKISPESINLLLFFSSSNLALK